MRLKLSDEEKHPIVAGLIALTAVAAVLGLAAGVMALLASNVAGLGGSGGNTAQAVNQGASLYLPTPSPTKSATGPLITLSPEPSGEGEGDQGPSESASVEPSVEPTPAAAEITLTVGATDVGSMQRIDLTGVYPGGEGALLQVQRREGGTWTDFPVSASVSGGQFSTYVQTGRTGKQAWRVIDSDAKVKSNVVKVTVR